MTAGHQKLLLDISVICEVKNALGDKIFYIFKGHAILFPVLGKVKLNAKLCVNPLIFGKPYAIYVTFLNGNI